jgi:hypothetical protein
MTPLNRLSRFLRRERVQTLRRHIYGCVSKRTTLLVLISVVGVLAVVSGAALSQSGTPPSPTAETNNSTVAPGAQIASAISVEGVALESDVNRRTLDAKLAQATSDEERAAIIATTIRRLDGRLDTLETRYQQLREARQAGTIRGAKYHVETTTIMTEAAMIGRMLGRLQTAATKLPAAQLETQYPNATSIERLAERARALTNGEVITTPTPTPTGEPTPTETTEPTPPSQPTVTPMTTPATPDATATDGSSATNRPAEGAGSNGGGGNVADDNGDDAGESDDDSDGTDDDDTDDNGAGDDDNDSNDGPGDDDADDSGGRDDG